VTAQLPEHLGKHQLERRITPPALPNNVESIPHNALNVRPATIIVPRSASATAPTLPTTNVRAPGSSVAVIPVGTTITLANWQQYSQYMPLGMTELFNGDQFWKIPPDLKIVV